MRFDRSLALGLVLLCSACAKQEPAKPPNPSISAEQVLSRFEAFLQAPLSDQARLANELEALGPQAAPYLEAQLRSMSAFDKRTAALIILQRINEKRHSDDFSQAQVSEYLAWLSDQDVVVRTYAMESLIRAGEPFRKTITDYRNRADTRIRDKLDIVLREMR